MLAACIALWLGLLLTLPPRPSPWLVVASGLPVLALASWQAARRRTRPWRAFLDDTADIHGLALVLLYALGVLLRDTHGITTDGVTYFAQLRSLVFDRDLDVAREFTVLGQPPRPNHVVPIGPTLLWAPLYLLVTLGDGLGRLAGLWRAPADAATLGLTTPYMRAALLSSFAVGGAGLVALLVFLRAQFSKGVAWTAVTLLFGATPRHAGTARVRAVPALALTAFAAFRDLGDTALNASGNRAVAELHRAAKKALQLWNRLPFGKIDEKPEHLGNSALWRALEWPLRRLSWGQAKLEPTEADRLRILTYFGQRGTEPSVPDDRRTQADANGRQARTMPE